MKVFVSSTVYDLLDVRAEVAEHLKQMGITPVLSDDKLSDFEVKQATNSIETCLVNVAAADEVIVILDKRYGPSLEKAGFGDFSATHLEYLRAVKEKKPLHVFVRDRLEADFAIWRKNKKKADVVLSWVGDKDRSLFTLLDKHSKLSNSSSNNWYTTFTCSIDLKAAIAKQFESRVLPDRLVEAFASNCFPIFEISQDFNIKSEGHIQGKFILTNVGGAPAFDSVFHWSDSKGENSHETKVVAVGSAFPIHMMQSIDYGQSGKKTKKLYLTYKSTLGITVEEEYEVSFELLLVNGESMAAIQAILSAQYFKRSDNKISFLVDEV